jgi:hypothetical protein
MMIKETRICVIYIVYMDIRDRSGVIFMYKIFAWFSKTRGDASVKED